MRTERGYRYTVQWSNDTPQKRNLGEVLERLGNQKSEFLIFASTILFQYYPNLLEDILKNNKLNLQISSSPAEEADIEAKVREVFQRMVMNGEIAVSTGPAQPGVNPPVMDDDAAQAADRFLANLDMLR